MEVLIIALGFYLLPSLIAVWKNKRQKGAIVAINILAGWTGIGYVVAFVMAVWAEKPEKDAK